MAKTTPKNKMPMPVRLALGATTACIALIAAIPALGGDEEAPAPKVPPASPQAWMDVVDEMEGQVPTRQLLGAAPTHPELLRSLKQAGITPDAFQAAGAKALEATQGRRGNAAHARPPRPSAPAWTSELGGLPLSGDDQPTHLPTSPERNMTSSAETATRLLLRLPAESHVR